METKFNSVSDFIDSFKNNTFGLYVVTKTTPTFKSKINPFMYNDVTKITFYKNAVCGASYNSILFQHIKKDILKTEKEMTDNFINFLKLIGIDYNIKPIFETFFKGINKVILKIKKNDLCDNFQEKLPWGTWIKYPIFISHTNKKGETNLYLRLYQNDDLTKIKTFYLIDGKLIDENTEIYDLLLSHLKQNTLPKKQEENGIRYKVIPFAYNVNNIIYMQQGIRIFDKTNFLTKEKINYIFKNI